LDRSFWQRRKVFVTGADGFAGSHLSDALVKRGAKVVAMVMPGQLKHVYERPGLDVLKGDVNDYQSVLRAMRNVDVVYHLAAITSIPETRSVIQSTYLTNAGGTLNVLLASRENRVSKVVYVSTCHVYGRQDRLPITEENLPSTIDIYSAGKLGGELVCKALVEMYGLDISISRAFNHFGPRQRKEFLIPSIILQAISKKPLVLGDSTPTRDFTYVDDIVEGYLAIGEKGKPNRVYNLSSGVERTIEEIANEVMKAGRFESDIQWNPGSRKVDIPRSCGSSERARSELYWSPKTSFQEGLKRTIDWYLAQDLQRPEVQA